MYSRGVESGNATQEIPVNLQDAEDLARKLMAEWLHPTWTFHWDNSKTRHGSCQVFDSKGRGSYKIFLSRPYTEINPREVVEDTIRHEIAHALTIRSYGHSDEWKANAVRVGARPEECASAENGAVGLGYKWIATCPACGEKSGARRRSKSMANGDNACAPCCRAHNGGEWDERFQLIYIQQW
jgi:predicted SprT family Zn-dependent metalloprotease